jgi:hypothetical protein
VFEARGGFHMRKAESGKMRSLRKPFVLLTVIGAALTALVFASGAFAYGKADAPIAQVEISGNCNNPTFDLCQEVGLGGVWAWAELDTAGGSADGGSMDFTFAGCGHTIGGGGPGSAGGGGGPGEGTWYRTTDLDAALGAGGAPFFDPSKTYDAYYVLDFFPGSGVDDFIAVVPASQGHYGWKPANGVSIQTQVAP